MWVAIFSGGDRNGEDIYRGGGNRGADDGGLSMEMKLRDSSPDVLGCGTSNGAWACIVHIAASLTAVCCGPWLAPSETT
jgi:hypothetical protein